MMTAHQWMVDLWLSSVANRDRMMESRVTDKIKEAEEGLQRLQRQEKAVMANIRTKSEQKKLTIF